MHDVLPADWEYPEDFEQEEEEDNATKPMDTEDSWEYAGDDDADFGQEEESEQQQHTAQKPSSREQPVPDEQVLQSAMRQLHRNLGHPENRSLARAIRLTGGSDEAIRLALSFKCPICHRLREPKPTAAAKLRQY